MSYRNENEEYVKRLTRDLTIGDVVAYPVGNWSEVLASCRTGWRRYTLVIKPDKGETKHATLTLRRVRPRTIWWVRKG